jgi:hypothetical protein
LGIHKGSIITISINGIDEEQAMKELKYICWTGSDIYFVVSNFFCFYHENIL